jgi:hypothetical protein
MLPFEALAFGLRGSNDSFKDEIGTGIAGEGDKGCVDEAVFDFGISIGTGAVVVCRSVRCTAYATSIAIRVLRLMVLLQSLRIPRQRYPYDRRPWCVSPGRRLQVCISRGMLPLLTYLIYTLFPSVLHHLLPVFVYVLPQLQQSMLRLSMIVK